MVLGLPVGLSVTAKLRCKAAPCLFPTVFAAAVCLSAVLQLPPAVPAGHQYMCGCDIATPRVGEASQSPQASSFSVRASRWRGASVFIKPTFRRRRLLSGSPKVQAGPWRVRGGGLRCARLAFFGLRVARSLTLTERSGVRI